jgi:hypothetical protein
MRHGGVVCAQAGGLGLDIVGWGSCVGVGVLDVVFVKSSAEAGVGESFEAMASGSLWLRECVCCVGLLNLKKYIIIWRGGERRRDGRARVRRAR